MNDDREIGVVAMRGRIQWAIVALVGALSLGATFAGPASARWNTHDGGGLVTELSIPAGASEWETCSDRLAGRTGWMAVDGEMTGIPSWAKTAVAYEVLKELAEERTQQVALFLTEERTELETPIQVPESGITVYTAAPFVARLADVRPGDILRLKPFPGVQGPTYLRLTAIDCGDSGFFNEWSGETRLCGPQGGRFVTGDVDRNRRSDVACHDPRTGLVTVGLAQAGGEFEGIDLRQRIGSCPTSSRLLMGDTNADNRADLLCHDPRTGDVRVSLSHGSAWLPRLGWRGELGCEPGASLFLGDVDGDRRADLVCHRTAAGEVEVMLAERGGWFTGATWRGPVGMCRAGRAQPHLGDANGDSRADLVCHDPATGRVEVALAHASSRFPPLAKVSTLKMCTEAGTQLRIADVTGDGRADLVCQDTGTGYVRLAQATRGGRYPSVSWRRNLGFCPGKPTSLQLADVNGDGRADLLCLEPGSDRVTAAYSDL